MLWASQSIVRRTPASRARRAVSSVRSRRSGAALISKRRAGRGGGGEDRVPVVIGTAAPADDPPRRVRDDIDVGVVDRLQESPGDGGAVAAQTGVERGDHDVQFGEDGIGQIERTIATNLHLGRFEEPERREFGVQAVDLHPLRADPLLVEAVGDGQAVGMVADAEIGVATRDRRSRPSPRSSLSHRSRCCASGSRRADRRA